MIQGLGELISVPLIVTVDTGGERFGFFLPSIDVPQGQTAHFHTVGVYEMFSGRDFIPTSAIDLAMHRIEWNGTDRDSASIVYGPRWWQKSKKFPPTGTCGTNVLPMSAKEGQRSLRTGHLT